MAPDAQLQKLNPAISAIFARSGDAPPAAQVEQATPSAGEDQFDRVKVEATGEVFKIPKVKGDDGEWHTQSPENIKAILDAAHAERVKQQSKKTGNVIGSIATQAAKGAMLGMGDKYAAYPTAAAKTIYGKLTGSGKTLQQNKKAEEEYAQKFEEDNPWTSTGIKIAGGAIPFIAGGSEALAAKIGGQALTKVPAALKWITGASPKLSTWGAIRNAAGSGAALGYGQSAVTGEGNPLVSAATGGALGGAMGLAAPVFAPMANKLASAVGNKIAPHIPGRIPSVLEQYNPMALAAVKTKMGQSGLTSPEAITAAVKKAGPNAMPFQYNREMANSLAKVMNEPGPLGGIDSAKTIGSNAIEQQVANLRGNVGKGLTNILGPKGDVPALQAAWDAEKKASGSLFNQFRSMAIPPTPQITAIQDKLGAFPSVFSKAKQFDQAEFGSGHFDPKNLTASNYQTINMALNDQIGEALAAGNKPTARFMIGLKNEMIDAIDKHPNKAIGQVWQQARNKFAQPAAAENAMELGMKWTKLDRDELPALISKMSVPERKAFVQGIWKHLDDLMDDARHGGNRIVTEGLKPGNIDRLAMIPEIGPKGAAQYEKMAKQFAQQAQYRGVAQGGSPTAERMANDELFRPGETGVEKLKGKYAFHVRPTEWLFPDSFVKSVKGDLADKFALSNRDVARILTLPRPVAEKVFQTLNSYKMPGTGLSNAMKYSTFMTLMSQIAQQSPALGQALAPYAAGIPGAIAKGISTLAGF